jgi:LuxR family transcriptional regulator, maltose regulon positive regulatory protein
MLVEQLLASQTTPIICVVAPVGYGKTTVLAQWAERKGGRVAWVSVDRRDNDPVGLLTYIAVALDPVEPIDRECSRPWPRPASPSSPPWYRGWRRRSRR